HGPRRPLLRAELAGSVNFPSRTLQVDLNVETMFAAAEAVALRRPEIYFVNAGADIHAPRLGHNIAAFADHDFRLALAVAVEAQSHLPGANARPFDDRVRGHVKIFNVQSVAAATGVAFAIIRRKTFRRHVHQKNVEKPGQQSRFYPLHKCLLMLSCGLDVGNYRLLQTICASTKTSEAEVQLPKLAIKRPNPPTGSLISINFMAYQIQAKLLVTTGLPISSSSNCTSVMVGQRGQAI